MADLSSDQPAAAAAVELFQPIARETVLNHFWREYDATFTQLEIHLDALTPASIPRRSWK